MLQSDPKKFRKLVPGRCRYCDRQFFCWRSARPKFFCDGKCRQADFRHTGYLGSKRNESHPKTPAQSRTFRPDFAGRGIVGPGYVIDIEIGIAEPPVDPTFQAKADALIATIPADLSIPDFLKRVRP
jgi:hypothetical protein